jgi:hypothetical protein
MDADDSREDLSRLLPALISEWSFVLLGRRYINGTARRAQAETSAPQAHMGFDGFSDGVAYEFEADPLHCAGREGPEPQTASMLQPSTGGDIDARTAFSILLERIVLNTADRKELQRDMLTYWEEMRDFFPFLIEIFTYDQRERREFGWKRNLIRHLLIEFRVLQKESRASKRESVAV